MKLKYKVNQIGGGKWAVWKNRTHYFTGMTYNTEQEAIERSLKYEGHELLTRVDEIQQVLEEFKMVPADDPYGWRA